MPCPVLASYILAFDLQTRKKHGETSARIDIPRDKNLQEISVIVTSRSCCWYALSYTLLHILE